MNDDLKARFSRLEPLIDRALELEGAERARFLALCAEIHPDLVADLRRALVDDEPLPALGALAEEITGDRPTDRRGLRAGAWRLLEKIGQGGMGAVYLAERADGAFDKRVAIKLLRGNDPRFKEQLERERRMLARLDHPGIARLIDGGVLPDGQPWLVMELAEGSELDLWLARERPSLARRLAVFMAVCDALSYAHAALVVHRDLKPGNIRVAADDSVKLLDFGIAKLLASDAQRGSTRHIALTPEFAAPEQLRGELVTTRTDVYALGALLYLMLSGRSPHPRFDGNWAGYIDHVSQVDAPRLSRAASDAAGSALQPALLQGDLDAIVAKALQRDPASRYASADALAQDVRRFLGTRPVLARRQSWQYRSGKWMRRNWLVAVMLVGIAVALGAGLAGMAWRSQQVAAERDAARREAQHSHAVNEYLARMFSGARAGDESARAVLQRAVEGIPAGFADDPEGRQQVRVALAGIHLGLGDDAAAARLLAMFDQEHDADTPALLMAQAQIYHATLAQRRGQPEAACAQVMPVFDWLDASRSDHQAALDDARAVRAQCEAAREDAASD